MNRIAHILPRLGARVLLGLAVLLAGGVIADPAAAQRPFRVHDPFYRGESARRPFYDGYAFTTEVAYRSPGSVQDGQQNFAPDFLGLSFRLDYQISSHIDIGAILDASGSNTGRTVGLSWLTFKYYETQENTDYAFRIAVDPAVDGRIGSPQLDLAFLTTTLLTSRLSSDNALGFRRVRVGYEQLVPADLAAGPVTVPEPVQRTSIVYTRALGWEAHAMSQYSVLLNPARNSVFVAGQLYVGKYDIFETALRRNVSGSLDENTAGYSDRAEEAGERDRRRERYGGAFWVRSGIEYNRPSFQVMPFMNFAVKRWVARDAEASPRLSVGVRFMLR